MLTPGVFGPITGNPVAPKFIRLAFNGVTVESNGSLKACVNVMDWYAPLVLPGGSLAAFIASIQASIVPQLVGAMSSDYILQSLTAKNLDTPLAIPTNVIDGTTGTVMTDRSASFTGVVIRKLTGVPSRSFRGSIHYGAVPESFTTQDKLNSTGTAAYQALQSQWIALVTSGVSDGASVFFPVVVSSIRSDLVSTPCVIWGAAITDYSLNIKLGIMKRRKEKGAA